MKLNIKSKFAGLAVVLAFLAILTLHRINLHS